MNEWISTGRLIDKLKVGEIAELEPNKHIPLKYGPSYNHVTKTADGDIKWCKGDGGLPSLSPIQIYGHVITWKWRILPKFVSFPEALKAYQDGEFIESYLGGDLVEPWAGYHKDMDDPHISICEILEAKWVIRELKE